MDHTEAREQLQDLALEPARLRGLDGDTSPGSVDLRAHLATCDSCRADLEGWRRTLAAFQLAVNVEAIEGDVPAGSFGKPTVSAGADTPTARLRARTLAAAAAQTPSPVGRVEVSRRSVRWSALLAMAAVLVVLLGGAAIVADRTGQLDRAQADAAAMAGVTATLDGILQDPGHQVAVLRTSAGTPAGSVSWSAADGSVVVLTTALQSPPPGQVYVCWIEQNGATAAVGEMQFSGSTAYWAGSLGSWGDSVAAGGRFWVSLGPIGGGAKGTQVLEGTL